MVFTGEASWRWRMMLPASDRSYDTFWRQACGGWRCPATDPDRSQRASRRGAPATGMPLRIAVRNAAFEPMPDATVDVRVTAPDGRVERFARAADRDGAGTTGRYRRALPAR